MRCIFRASPDPRLYTHLVICAWETARRSAHCSNHAVDVRDSVQLATASAQYCAVENLYITLPTGDSKVPTHTQSRHFHTCKDLDECTRIIIQARDEMHNTLSVREKFSTGKPVLNRHEFWTEFKQIRETSLDAVAARFLYTGARTTSQEIKARLLLDPLA